MNAVTHISQAIGLLKDLKIMESEHYPILDHLLAAQKEICEQQGLNPLTGMQNEEKAKLAICKKCGKFGALKDYKTCICGECICEHETLTDTGVGYLHCQQCGYYKKTNK